MPSQLALTALTALGCLAVGATLVRLTPLKWLAVGIAAMCVVDVALLGTGVGQPAAHEMQAALSHSALPEFDRAQIGPMSKDYPDLVLAATFGSAVAGNPRQLIAAVLVTVLCCANGVLFLVASTLPATGPIGVAADVVLLLERRSRATRRRGRDSLRAPVFRPSTLGPDVAPAKA